MKVRAYLARATAQDRSTIPMIALSRIAHQSCPYANPSANYRPAAYKRWVRGFADALGSFHVMVLVEPDRVATMSCLPAGAQRERNSLLRFDMRLLRLHSNAIVYLDAGASDWVRSTHDLALRLRRAGVQYGQGFALNASHFDSTAANVAYGLAVSKYLGGAHFVVNTDANAHRPSPAWRARMGGCQPPNVGVGIRPTVHTGNPLVDAFLWLDTPGYASGHCIHQGAGFAFDPKLALTMERNAGPPF